MRGRYLDVAVAAMFLTPAIVYLIVIFVVPLLMLVVSSFIVSGRASASNFIIYLSEEHNLSVAFTKTRFSLVTAIICAVLGYTFARFLIAMPTTLQGAIFILIVIPMIVSVIVKTFGWTVLLRRDGPVNQLLMWSGVVDRPVRLVFTETGVTLGAIGVQLSLMILPIYANLRSIPGELGESAATLGAGWRYRLFHLDLPLALPGIMAGLSLVFAQTAAAYVVPALLGGSRFKTLSSTIVDSYLVLKAGELGATVSVILLVIISTVLLMFSFMSRFSTR